ncbi:MAG: universal stress protein [Hyphomicrobiales bacterium]
MALKSIVCLFEGFAHEIEALETAMELAQRNKSHLRIVHPQSLPQLYLGMHGLESMRGGDFYETVERQNAERLGQARDTAQRLARQHAMAFDFPVKDGNGAWAQFVPLPYSTGAALVREISLSDLIIVGQDWGWSTVSEQTTLGTALFATYRPICLVRPAKPADTSLSVVSGAKVPQWKGETALIAWRDSAESMRATLGALPLLQAAKNVFIVTAHDHGTSVSAQTYLLVLDYLASHDVKAEVIDLDRGDQSAASTVLAKAHDVGADFVTMGAYGHSVFREMLLGGFSATMLENCQLPLILSH